MGTTGGPITTTTQPSRATSRGPSSYLLVCEATTSRVVELPANGRLSIGRSNECAVVLADVEASRVHAELVIEHGRAAIADCSSQNGTRVDGRAIEGARALETGVVIEIGETRIVYYASHEQRAPHPVGDLDSFRRAIAREIERTRASHRGFVVLALRCTDLDGALGTLMSSTRAYDVVARDGDDVLILLPEIGTAGEYERDLRSVLGAAAVIVGRAACPGDAVETSALLKLARSGTVSPAAPGRTRNLRAGALEIIAAEPATLQLYALVERLARSDVPILVRGETGSGKEVLATALHHWSRRAQGPLISINCAALPEQLVESELFGHERGAFSGANASKAGLLEAAHGGTVFLDEIGDLAAPAQAKLLRAIENKRVVRVGAVAERAINVRLVAATNHDLERAVAEGTFRRDLYYRLTGGVIVLPPLRVRPRELVLLARAFLHRACADLEREPITLSDSALVELANHDWPGNVRELKHVVEYLAAAFPDAVLSAEHVRSRLSATPRLESGAGSRAPLREQIEALERAQIAAAMRAQGGHQANAAQQLGMPLRTLVNKLRRYNLRRT